MIQVTRTEVEPLTTARGVPFLDGATTFFPALKFSASCGCCVEIGIRADKPSPDEKAMLAWACDLHRPKWGSIMEAFQSDDRETSVALAAALEAAA